MDLHIQFIPGTNLTLQFWAIDVKVTLYSFAPKIGIVLMTCQCLLADSRPMLSRPAESMQTVVVLRAW